MIKEETKATVIPLGIAGPLVDAHHESSYLAVEKAGRYWLVDCAGNAMGRLQQVGLDPLALQGIIITHFHPDHVYGLPAFLLGLYVMGMQETRPRQQPLPIYARPIVLPRIIELLELFDYQDWLDALPVSYREIAPEPGVKVTQDLSFKIAATPTHHSIPSLAIRFTTLQAKSSFIYSSDTLPCFEVEELARDAALLFHEGAGEAYGHSTPAAAGALATRAGVEKLAIMHYPIESSEQVLQEARSSFAGPVELAEELKRYYF